MVEPRNILLTSVNNLGDCVVFLPVAAATRTAWPKARIALLTGGAAAGAARLTGLIDEFIELPAAGGWPPRWGLLRLAGRVRRSMFDLGIMASGDSSFVAALMRLGGVAERVGFDDCAASFLLTRRATGGGAEHEAARNMRLAVAVGLPATPARPPCRIGPGLVEEARKDLAREGVEPGTGAPLVLIHPGASTPARRWPAGRFAALAGRLAREAHARPALVEGPAERGLAQEIARLAGLPIPTLRPVRVEALGAIVAQCDLFIGHSSGPFHVACLVGTPTVSLWGDTDPALWGPAWEPERHAVVRSPLPCAPCERWDGRAHRIVRGSNGAVATPCAECLAAISEQTVWDAVVRQLEAIGHRGS